MTDEQLLATYRDEVKRLRQKRKQLLETARGIRALEKLIVGRGLELPVVEEDDVNG